MKRLAGLAALCVFLLLLASPGRTIEPNLWRAVPATMHEAVPRAKPDRNHAMPEGVEIVRQCAASTMMMRTIPDTDVRLYYARYSKTAFDGMVAAGCTRIQRGCNTCTIAYTGCTAEERAACTTGDCLDRVCKRRAICTARGCTAQAEAAPSCDARFVRQACLETAFDTLDSALEPRE